MFSVYSGLFSFKSIKTVFNSFFSKRDIASGNFVMHEVHCRRNLILCEHCQEPVPRSDLDAHFEEFHAKVPCPRCGEQFEKTAVKEHEVRQSFQYHTRIL